MPVVSESSMLRIFSFFVPAVVAGAFIVASPAVRAASRPASSPPASPAMVAEPARVVLDGADAEQALQVTSGTGVFARDVTARALFRSLSPQVAKVDAHGVVRPVKDGSAIIELRAGGRVARVPVTVRGSGNDRPISFRLDVMPVLMKAGCYQGACHAKQGGQNGFQLSVLGFDPEADFAAVVRQGHGRRVNREEPARSLLLLKPTLAMPHAGGRRFEPGSPSYRLLARWLAQGAPYGPEQERTIVRVEVLPTERTLAPGGSQQLLATAVYSDGTRRDISRMAQYQSNETGIAEVDDTGHVQASKLAGEAAVMVRYLGQITAARFTVPQKQRVPPEAYRTLPRQNLIDDFVYRKLSQLNLLPSESCDDATFLRRASLDLIGTLPTAAETKAFLDECDSGKDQGGRRKDETPESRPAPATQERRQLAGTTPSGSDAAGVSAHPSSFLPQSSSAARARLVDRLLARPEYADYWAMRWVNLLLVDRDPLFPKGAFAYDQWVRKSFRENVPFDRFAREIVTASGETYRDGAANFYRSLVTPIEDAKAISQLFLGVRIDCAQCHHHPNERWSQDDFYSMAAFFARVKRKGSPEFEQVVYNGTDGEVVHPKTGKVMPPRALGEATPPIAEEADRRESLAAWMTAPQNPYFARTIVNRMWGLLMGRGLVEPIDDFRVTNPATNEPLLDALAKDFVEHGYDLKHLLRTIAGSAAYQRSSRATANNARDTHNYSRAYVKRLPAEVLLDAVAQVTGVAEPYNGHPAGMRAIQMWDNKLPNEFLDVFGRPSRLSVCECDRPADGSVTQVLHLMNAPAVQNRLTSDSGIAARLAASELPPDRVVEELYLSLYSRHPQPDELAAARAVFTRKGATRRTATEDLLWVMLNSPEFLFNH